MERMRGTCSARGDLRLFAGTSNPQLASSIAKLLGIELGSAEIKRFADGETSVLLGDSVRGKDVFLLQSTSPPVNDNVMELGLFVDALRRASAGRITTLVPYYGYGRQDRLVGRSPISSRLVADLICTSGTDAFISVDLHSNSIGGFFNIPFDNLSAAGLFANHFREKFGSSLEDECVVVSPDVGGVKRARNLARQLGCPLAVIDKQRPKPNQAEVVNVIGDVSGKKTIMIDDMVDTASSIAPGTAALIDRGAIEVYAAATHPVLSPPAFQRIEESRLKEIIFTDSIPLKPGAPSKVKVLSLAPLLAETIQRQHLNEPVSGLFRS